MYYEYATAVARHTLERHCRCGAIATVVVMAQATHVSGGASQMMVSAKETAAGAEEAAARKADSLLRLAACPACNERDPDEVGKMKLMIGGVATIVGLFFVFCIGVFDAYWFGGIGILMTLAATVLFGLPLLHVDPQQLEVLEVTKGLSPPPRVLVKRADVKR